MPNQNQQNWRTVISLVVGALQAAILFILTSMRSDVKDIVTDVSNLKERVSHIEGRDMRDSSGFLPLNNKDRQPVE